jgi:glycosyltransferase involved in cell wall biosynthesis
MEISIGILAWNEEKSIAATLRSLFSQTLFRNPERKGLNIEVVCVPNGCSDNTAGAAREAFESYRPPHIAPERLRLKVHEVIPPSKSNAWNVYVHEAADPTADLLFLMDADIEFVQAETLGNMIRVFEQSADVLAVNDLPVKHIQLKEHKNPADRISLSINRGNRMVPGQLTGQLYGIRGEFVRRFRIPRGILVEDGFIKYMIVTRLYTQPADNSLIRTAENSSHVFEGYTSFKDIFNHQRRQAVSAVTLNRTLTYLKAHCGPDYDAGQLISDKDAGNPDWLIDILRSDFEGGSWLIPRHILFARFMRCKNGTLPERIKKFLLALAVFGFDLGVFCSANHALKTGQLSGVWKDTKNKAKVLITQ